MYYILTLVTHHKEKINYLSIRNHSYTLIDFLRLPRPQGERRTEPRLRGELGEAKINLLPLGLG